MRWRSLGITGDMALNQLVHALFPFVTVKTKKSPAGTDRTLLREHYMKMKKFNLK